MSTRLITKLEDLRAFAREARAPGKSLGLVPTMGALHEGHLSLVRHARRQCDVVVVSIYVNPTQFGLSEDFTRYPRDLKKDFEVLRALNVDAAFAAVDAEIYPEGFQTFVEPGEIAVSFEGASRPGHFRGVATVVLKLLNAVRPDIAYFGQKDFQQVQVVRRLIEDLNLDVRLVVCPTVRESDGLALSTRNAYLSAEEREAARALPACLRRAQELAHAGETRSEKLLEEMRKVLAAEPRAEFDYLAIVEPAGLRPVERVMPGSVALGAVRMGPVRLLDNLIFGPPGASPELLLQLALTAQPVVDARGRVPGLETEALRLKIERCRDCAAISSILLPPREFLPKYLKRDYPDLNSVRTVIIGRDSPLNPDHFLYRRPGMSTRFVQGLYELLGVKDFNQFKTRFALTDAVRCHALGNRVAEKALDYCARHLREELKLFPNLESIVVLGEDAYLQCQKFLLGRDPVQIKPFEDLLKSQGWAEETCPIPLLGERALRVFYCRHPTYGYKRSPSIAAQLT
jgi:pantoate--beta-alanine ligase